jgi:2-methylisocitrate lyase-like PEP mutase family enzyme
LLLAGWDGGDRETLPDVVRDLAHAAAGRDFVFPCEADRLHQILRALDAVQVFPRTSACCTMRGVTDALHRLKTKAGNAAVQINGVSKPVFAFNTARNQLTRCYFVELTAEMKAGASNEIEVTVPVIAGLTFGGAYLDLPDQMPLGEVDK